MPDSTPRSDDGVASRSDGCEQRERRKSPACTRSTTHFATLPEAVETLADQDGWRGACARNRTPEPAVARHYFDTVYRTRRSRGFPLSQGRSSTCPLSASPGSGLYPILHAEGRRSTLELTEFSDGRCMAGRTRGFPGCSDASKHRVYGTCHPLRAYHGTAHHGIMHQQSCTSAHAARKTEF